MLRHGFGPSTIPRQLDKGLAWKMESIFMIQDNIAGVHSAPTEQASRSERVTTPVTRGRLSSLRDAPS
jgi:hypothetical protein